MASDQQCENFYGSIKELGDKSLKQALQINDIQHGQVLSNHKIKSLNTLVDFLKIELGNKADKKSVDDLAERVDKVCRTSEENNKVIKAQNKYSLMIIICLGFFTFVKMSEEFPGLLPTIIKFMKFVIELAKFL